MNRSGPAHSPEFPRLMAGITAVCAAGGAAVVWPAAEHAVGAGLLVAPLAVGAVWAARREARSRGRLADTTSTSTRELPRAAVDAGRAPDTAGATP